MGIFLPIAISICYQMGRRLQCFSMVPLQLVYTANQCPHFTCQLSLCLCCFYESPKLDQISGHINWVHSMVIILAIICCCLAVTPGKPLGAGWSIGTTEAITVVMHKTHSRGACRLRLCISLGRRDAALFWSTSGGGAAYCQARLMKDK